MKKSAIAIFLSGMIFSVVLSAAPKENKPDLVAAGTDDKRPGVTKEERKDPILIQAIRQNQAAKVESLLSNGSNVNERDKDRNTPLMWAAASGRVETVHNLLNRGAYITAQNVEGKT